MPQVPLDVDPAKIEAERRQRRRAQRRRLAERLIDVGLWLMFGGVGGFIAFHLLAFLWQVFLLEGARGVAIIIVVSGVIVTTVGASLYPSHRPHEHP